MTQVIFSKPMPLIICKMMHLMYIFNSLATMESESINPEWFFKTTIVIEPERIEFEKLKLKRQKVLELVT